MKMKKNLKKMFYLWDFTNFRNLKREAQRKRNIEGNQAFCEDGNPFFSDKNKEEFRFAFISFILMMMNFYIFLTNSSIWSNNRIVHY